MSSAYGHIAKPETDLQLQSVLPIHELLRDGTPITIEAVDPTNDALVEHMRMIFNVEIEDGFVVCIINVAMNQIRANWIGLAECLLIVEARTRKSSRSHLNSSRHISLREYLFWCMHQ